MLSAPIPIPRLRGVGVGAWPHLAVFTPFGRTESPTDLGASDSEKNYFLFLDMANAKRCAKIG